MDEAQETRVLANRILDRPYADPDDDLAMLSRQLLRADEKLGIMRSALEELAYLGNGDVLGNSDGNRVAQRAYADCFGPLPSVRPPIATEEKHK
jgi:hypothetical protein